MAEGDAPVIELDVNEIVTDLNAEPESQTGGESETSTEENKETKPAEKPAEGEKKPAEGAEAAEGEAETKPNEGEETKTETAAEGEAKPPHNDPEARKAALSGEIREMVATKKDLETQIAGLTAKVYAAATPEELMEADDTLSEGEARAKSLEEQMVINNYNRDLADVNMNLTTQSLQALHDFPVFDKQSSEYDEDFANAVSDYYWKIAGVKFNPKINAVESVQVLPYETYKMFATIRAAGATTGKVEGQKAAEKMIQAAEDTPAVAPKAGKPDPFLDGLLQGRGK